MHARLLGYLFAFAIICIALGVAGLLEQRFGDHSISGNPALEALLGAYAGKPLSLDAPARTNPCHVDGPLPDHSCTPGAVFADATLQQMCTPGFSAGVRSVSVSLKKKIYQAYGIVYPQPTGSFELDHLIPLELGGDNEAANLFPEAADPTPGFKEKDLVEDYLHEEVCAGRVELAAAQQQIATNWVAVYQTLSPATIAGLKQQFTSWAN